jgi:drug/metabolite transporter (DMT)-like permease
MGTDPLNALTVFVTTMVALSVAAERVTETIKQWATPVLEKMSRSGNTAATQCIAVVSGIFVVVLSGLNPTGVPGFVAFQPGNPRNWSSWIVGGILVAGGSAFWNHALDILKAAKVQKEAAVNAVVPQSQTITS